VNLSKEEEVEYLLKALAGLRYLNGLDVDREELEIQDEESDNIVTPKDSTGPQNIQFHP
jgi:hypothetical protein